MVPRLSGSQCVQSTVSVTPLTVGEVGRDVPPAATPCVSTWVDPPDSCVPDDVDHGLEVSVSSTVPGLRLQNRFSPLDEPIVREIDEGASAAVRPLVDGAEVELPPSPRQRRPTRRWCSSH